MSPTHRSQGKLYPQAPRPDELPRGLPAPAEPPNRGDFDERGKFAEGNQQSRKGGKAKAGQTKLAKQLGLVKLTESSDFAPYRRAAKVFARAQRAALAASVGGGVCGPGPSSMVASAALQLAASRYLSDRAAVEGNAKLFAQASRLADASRQNLLAAHECCAREAKARPVDPGRVPWFVSSDPKPETSVPACCSGQDAPQDDGAGADPSDEARPSEAQERGTREGAQP